VQMSNADTLSNQFVFSVRCPNVIQLYSKQARKCPVTPASIASYRPKAATLLYFEGSSCQAPYFGARPSLYASSGSSRSAKMALAPPR